MRRIQQQQTLLLYALSVAAGAAPTQESTVEVLMRQLKEADEHRLLTVYNNRRLAAATDEWSSTSAMYSASGNSLAEGDGSIEWDEYQQAWRYLGFMVDCESAASHWDDDDANGSGSGDYAYSDNQSCKRYILWAAYVDMDYSGGGIGEYQYWDRYNDEWDTNPCNYASSGDGRCAKMDCHLPDTTTWTLLGLFKHRQPDDWMEQLFKHEGMCVWSQEEYAFMKNARKAWPTGCAVASGSTTLAGGSIYYAIKPTAGGGITMGLYSDDGCTQEYDGSVKGVLGDFLTSAQGSGSGDNYDYSFDDLSFSEAKAFWDDAFDVWKTCQPCVAYDLNNVGYNGGDQGSAYGTYYCETDDYYGGQNANCANDDFSCYDDAGYENVNQCMKFRAKTYMDPATIRDVMLAHRQGTLVETSPLQGMEEPPKAGFFGIVGRTLSFFVVLVYFAVGAYACVMGTLYVRKARNHLEWPDFKDFKVPLSDSRPAVDSSVPS